MNIQTTFELRNVDKVFPMGDSEVKALDNVNLSIREGEFISICGPSGSGKSTLLNILGCLDEPSDGELVIDNELLVNGMKKDVVNIRRNKIGFIFQNYHLIPNLTVYENVEFPLLLKKVKSVKRKELINHALETVDLSHRADHYPKQLSGGECQRVSIARALVKHPKLIIADEPTANLDSLTAKSIIQNMKQINQEDNITFIFSTHDERLLNEVDRVVKLEDGHIVGDSNHD